MRKTTKFISVLLSAVLVLSLVAIPGFNTFATTLTAAEAYAVNELGATIGEQLLSETFSNGNMSTSVASYANPMPNTDVSGWKFISTDNAVIFANQTGKFKINGGRIEMWNYGGDSVAALPDIGTSNYIISAKIKFYSSTQSGRAGFITDLNDDVESATVSKRFGLESVSGSINTAYTQLSDNSATANNVTLTTAYTAADEITLSLVSFGEKNYCFVNDEMVTSIAKYANDSERLALYITTSDAYFDDIMVTALSAGVVLTPEEQLSIYAQEELGATVGEELLFEDFSKGDLSSTTDGTISSSHTNVAGWQYVGNGRNTKIAYNGTGTTKYRIKNGMINAWCTGGDGIFYLPELDLTDYIYTVNLKYGGQTGTSKAGLVTDLNGDADNATTSKRFGVYYNATTAPYNVSKLYSLEGTNHDYIVEYDFDEGLNVQELITLSVISYGGVNYYFLNGKLVGNEKKIGTVKEYLGFYISTADTYFDNIRVTELIAPAPPKSEEDLLLEELGATVGEEILNEPFEKGNMGAKIISNGNVLDISSDYTTAPGWKMTNTSNILWTVNEGQLKIANGRTNFWCYYGNAALVLPDLDTSNYVFTAKVKRGGGGEDSAEVGFITDIDGDISSANALKRFGVRYSAKNTKTNYPVEYFVTKTAPYESAEEIHDAPEDKYFLNDYITLKVISFGGTNYYFVNGDYILSLEKNDIADERLALYVRSGDFYIDDVSVTKLEYNIESELVDVYGMNAVKIGAVDDNATYKVDFEYVAKNDFGVGFFTADADNANSVGYAEGKDVAIYNVDVVNDNLRKATTYVTVDKRGASDDAVGSDLYMYVIGDVTNITVADVTAEKIKNAKGGALVSNKGVSILKDVAENETQAMRYYFNYDTTADGENIVIGGEVYSVKSRGFLIANGGELGGEQITRTTAKTINAIDYNVKNLSKCWEATANGDTLGSDSLCYSIYVTGFGAVDGTYNNTNRLYVKGYVVVEIDGTDYTFYAEEVNMTVSEVANLIK